MSSARNPARDGTAAAIPVLYRRGASYYPALLTQDHGLSNSIRSTTIALGVRNLFDPTPPITNQRDSFPIGYDPTYGDPRGRTFLAGSLNRSADRSP